jgi:hypothetical protein
MTDGKTTGMSIWCKVDYTICTRISCLHVEKLKHWQQQL